MKITVINGTEKQGVTYKLKESFLDKLKNPAEITEFYLPKDCPNFCVGCTVCFVDDIESVPVKKWGEALRYHPYFSPKGTNVNFAQRMPDGSIRVRTYERGVEGETLACGTGVTATALVSAAIFHLQSPVKIHTRGGDILQVGFVREGVAFKNVTLTGPAEIAFKGQVEI